MALAGHNWRQLQKLLHWSETDVQRYITHQVGSAHRNLLFEKLELDINKDFSSFQALGNMGTASIAVTLAMAQQQSILQTGDNIALLGIGSGLVSMMMGIKW